MSRNMLRALMGASALIAASALAFGASAQTNIQGGGSTLIAPYATQAAYCFDSESAVPGVNVAGNDKYLLPSGSPQPVTVPPPVSGGLSCIGATGLFVADYDATGSGAGQAGLFAHDYPSVNPLTSATLWGTPGFLNAGIQYAFSDNALVDADVGVYAKGTSASYTPPGRTAITTAANYQGLTFAASGANYPVAQPKYGPLVQFPVSIDPVAISFNPDYSTGNVLNIQTTFLDLDSLAYCGIFNGTITDWGDDYLTFLNNNTALAPKGSSPITLVGRSDSSGTTSIFTRHLAAVCSGLTIPAVGTTPARAITQHYTAGVTTLTATAVTYTLASGSGGVASALNSTPGSIGYIGPDYVLPAVLNTGANSFNLPSAALKNHNGGSFQRPSPAGATAAFASISPPTGAAMADQTQWVQSTASTAAVADPVSGAYPIVGTTNFLGYTCYASPASVQALQLYIGYINTPHDGLSIQGQDILENAGLAQMPSGWLTAITNEFLSTNNSGDNLFLDNVGAGSTNTNCAVSGVVGG